MTNKSYGGYDGIYQWQLDELKRGDLTANAAELGIMVPKNCTGC